MMNRLLVVVAGVVACLLVGCVSSSTTQEASRVDLGFPDAGKTVELAPNAVVRVSLDSNVTTGYAWTLKSLDTQIVEKTKQEYVAPQTTAVGAGGVEVWTFTARSTGRTTLRLEYARSWETNVAPAKTFELTLVVR